MPRLTLEMDLDNAALQDEGGYISHEAIASILRDVAGRIEESQAVAWALYDVNGNRVGSATVEPDEKEG